MSRINCLCKHRKNVRSSQASISINFCTKLSKTDQIVECDINIAQIVSIPML